MEVEAADLASAASKAIRTLERDGRRVLGLEVDGGPRRGPPASASHFRLDQAVVPVLAAVEDVPTVAEHLHLERRLLEGSASS